MRQIKCDEEKKNLTSDENTYAERFMGQKKEDFRKTFGHRQSIYLGVCAYIFLCWMLVRTGWYVCMVRCGRPGVFMRLCMLHTIKDYILCDATVESRTNLLKAPRNLGVCTYYS